MLAKPHHAAPRRLAEVQPGSRGNLRRRPRASVACFDGERALLRRELRNAALGEQRVADGSRRLERDHRAGDLVRRIDRDLAVDAEIRRRVDLTLGRGDEKSGVDRDVAAVARVRAGDDVARIENHELGIDEDVAAGRLRGDAARLRADQRVRRHDLTPRCDDDVAAGRVRGARTNSGRVERERILGGHGERACVAHARAARRQQRAAAQQDRIRRQHDVAAGTGIRSRSGRLARDPRVRDLEVVDRDVDLAAVAGKARVADDLRAVREREARRVESKCCRRGRCAALRPLPLPRPRPPSTL